MLIIIIRTLFKDAEDTRTIEIMGQLILIDTQIKDTLYLPWDFHCFKYYSNIWWSIKNNLEIHLIFLIRHAWSKVNEYRHNSFRHLYNIILCIAIRILLYFSITKGNNFTVYPEQLWHVPEYIKCHSVIPGTMITKSCYNTYYKRICYLKMWKKKPLPRRKRSVISLLQIII